MTEIRKGYPPNIDQIRSSFKLSGREIFAWAGIIYTQSGGPLSPALVAHEEVHFRQQAECGGPEAWWDRYLRDRAFRLDQELAAHIVEYQAFSKQYGRQLRRAFLKSLGKRLASPMYGGMITRREAMDRIKRGAA